MPRNTHLTSTQIYTITNALRVAADQYTRDAENLKAEPGTEHLTPAFTLQSTEARKLVELFEQADSVNVYQHG